jgi:hypothetical protein
MSWNWFLPLIKTFSRNFAFLDSTILVLWDGHYNLYPCGFSAYPMRYLLIIIGSNLLWIVNSYFRRASPNAYMTQTRFPTFK